MCVCVVCDRFLIENLKAIPLVYACATKQACIFMADEQMFVLWHLNACRDNISWTANQLDCGQPAMTRDDRAPTNTIMSSLARDDIALCDWRWIWSVCVCVFFLFACFGVTKRFGVSVNRR